MNRYREDTPYVFSPPKYSPFWAPVIYAVSDSFYLRQRHKVVEVNVLSGADEIRRMHGKGDSLLIAPNHSDHCDPHTLLHLARRFKMPLHFMAARQIFEKKLGIHGAVLQKAGVFSIDREGSDLKSIKEAIRILVEAKYPLVMFPEGEIYHVNEKLTPLNEGAASLSLRAAKKIAKDTKGNGAFLVPTAMKYTYIDDVSPTFPETMAGLERHILWSPQEDLDIVDRIYKFGEALLALKEKELLDRTLRGRLDERLGQFREILISMEEKRYFSEVSHDNHPTRVRRLRGKIRSILLDREKPTDEVVRRCYRSLDRLHTAIQLYSYPGHYLKEKRSKDRIAETLHKFEEDLFDNNRILGRRRVDVTFCEPVDLLAFMDRFSKDSKATVTEVTELVESKIRRVLEE